MACVFFVIGTFLGATDVWVEPALVKVFPESNRSPRASDEIRLYAARGERESCQICVRAGSKRAANVTVTPEPLTGDIGAPLVRRVGYLEVGAPSARACGTKTVWPDPLLDSAPLDVPERTTQAYWVTYTIPRTAAAGIHRGRIQVSIGKRATRTIPATVDVFDFELPEVPSVRTSFPLNRRALRQSYGLDNADLAGWMPIYDAFSDYRLSFGLWDDEDLVNVRRDGSFDTALFTEHLGYAVKAAHMNTINIGKGAQGIAPFPEPEKGAVHDPLQGYLHAIGNWLQSHGWLDRAYIQVMAPPKREAWQEARRAYLRVWRADKRVRRLLVCGPHPFLERYTDLWATPLEFYDYAPHDRLQAGWSLRSELPNPPTSVSASSSGTWPNDAYYASSPSDGYDGCLFTSWWSAAPPTRDKPQWFQIDLAEPVETETIKICWKQGFEAEDISVDTAYNGRVFSSADVAWDHSFSSGPFTPSWSEGVFRFKKTFLSIRFKFRKGISGGPVGIVEVAFDNAPSYESAERISPPELWTYRNEGGFPSFSADAPAVDARLFPWVCWDCGFRGFLCEGLNDWPSAWVGPMRESPNTWSGGGDGSRFLFYPGETAPLPSVRAELLRDGLEDYEYLTALQKAVREHGSGFDAEVVKIAAPRVFTGAPPVNQMDGWEERIERTRLAIGRAMTQRAPKKSP